jgi:DNA-directed RNA polymerase specialized sigma subunit
MGYRTAFAPEIEGTIYKIVDSFYRRNNLLRHINNTREDLLSEARIAALIAIRRYDSSRKVKLNTYVGSCVKNRLKDLNREAYCSKRGIYDPLADMSGVMESFSDTTINVVQLRLDTRKMLSSEEYEFFSMILEGHTFLDVVKEFRKRNNDLSKNKAGEEIRQCFTRIWRKLKSTEMSRALISKKYISQSSEETLCLQSG